MKSFIGNDQYFELHLEAHWKPIEIKKQRCYMGTLRQGHHCLCHCILSQLKLTGCLQGQPYIERIAVVKSLGDQAMSD